MAKLSVLVGAPPFTAALPAGQVVIVEADIDRARALKLELKEIGAIDRVLIAAEVLTTDYGQPVLWHQFNDGRLNGPWPLEHWHAIYPNLKTQQIEERTGRSLAEVLEVWQKQLAAEVADNQKTIITLILRQGDALATLAGCGVWLRDLQSVQLDHPVTNFSEQQAVASWLSQRGFCTAEGNGLHWQRDPMSTLRLELEESHEKVMQMEEQLSCHAVHLLLAETKNQEQTNERDNLRIEKDILITEKQQLAEQVDALTQQRDDLSHERDDRTTERDNLHIEKDILFTEKQQLAEQVDALTQQWLYFTHEKNNQIIKPDDIRFGYKDIQSSTGIQNINIIGLNADKQLDITRGIEYHDIDKMINFSANEIHSQNQGACQVIQDSSTINSKFEDNYDKYVEFVEHVSLKELIKVLAFYLPQFHPFPENDEWWGRGFTEWTNVGKAIPMFKGHYQPHCPIHYGYYDLRIVENMIAQVSLAKNYGISGFSYYFYWFEGKVIMEQPLLNMLAVPEVEMPFCLFWANENWSRRWDGSEDEILIAQNHSLQDSSDFFDYIKKYLLDPRYILINGRPILMVYRADIIGEIREITDMWRSKAKEIGFQDLYLVAAQTFGTKDPTPMGFDAAVEFPPHGVNDVDISGTVEALSADFEGKVHDYEAVVRSKSDENIPSYKKHYTCMLGWDNTARRRNGGTIYSNFSLKYFEEWFSSNLAKTIEAHSLQPYYPLLTFINAWNEWAEGTHLEPDQLHGYGYLEAAYRNIKRFSNPKTNH